MADLPKHPARVDEPPPPTQQSRLAYAKGRNIALAIYLPASALTAPIVLLFSAYPAAGSSYAEGEGGAFVLLCALVTAGIVHGGVTIGLLTFALIRYRRGNPVEANRLVRGWIYGVTVNVLLFLAGVLVLRLTVYSKAGIGMS